MRAEERRVTILELRQQGLKYREIAQRLGLSRSWVSHIASEKALESTRRLSREAKKRRTGICIDCGDPTHYSGKAIVVGVRCVLCNHIHIRADHGTRSRYDSGCRCDECRAAINAYQREWRRRRRKGGGGSPSPRPPT